VSRARQEPADPPVEVLRAFAIERASLRRSASGLINRTWFARDAHNTSCVLQRVNPVFPAAIHYDIDVVTKHLGAKGLPTPLLIPTRSGALWHSQDGAVWRAMTHVDGESYEALRSTEQAREAGRVLASFHRALADLDHVFRNARLGVHDTAKHLEALRTALEKRTDHAEYKRVAALGAEVLELAGVADPPADVPDRIVHGDPKVSNVVFAPGGAPALCLIDLDTLARMPVEFELGDAFRSWCNPKTEDAQSARFELPLFKAALTGYAEQSAGLLEPAEWRAIPAAIFRIAVELAARFCTDALREQYFGWDARRYATASEHNQARTRGQLNLARTIQAQRAAIEDAVADAFSA
jgi:Ser/Thr protein kinase RdoA (MazF antagonist)